MNLFRVFSRKPKEFHVQHETPIRCTDVNNELSVIYLYIEF